MGEVGSGRVRRGVRIERVRGLKATVFFSRF